MKQKGTTHIDLGKINPHLGRYFSEAKKQQSEAVDTQTRQLDEKMEALIAVSRFADLEFHASGGLKEIQVVHDRFTRRKIAYARLKSDHPEPAQILDFLKEASITARLQHQNIVPVHKIDIDEQGRPYFSMKLIEGDSLQVLLSLGAVKLAENFSRIEILEIFCKVCDAMSYAHSQGVLHMDLKPDNIVVGDYGEVILCDWGIALEKDEEGKWINSSSGHLQGTPGYIAPERLKGTRELDERTDVYSLGVIMYNILTCRHPFSGSSVQGIIDKTLKDEFVLPGQLVSDLPPALESVILKAMALDRDDRYISASELATDVRSWLGGFATEAEGAGFMTQAKLFIKRNMIESITLLTALLLISSLTAVFIVQLADREQRALVARDKAEQEKQLRLQLRKRAAVHFYKNANRSEKLHRFEQALSYAEMVVDFVPENKGAHYLLGKIYLAQGKYSQALKSFANAEGRSLDEYVAMTSQLNRSTQNEDILNVLHQCSSLPGGRRVVGAFCLYQPELIKRLGVFKLIEKIVANETPQNFIYNESKEFLKIDSSSFNFLAPITVLPLRSLDVSFTAISYLYPISRMPLIELNVSNTNVTDLNPLKVMKLEKLNISETNISDIQSLAALPLKELDISGLRLHFEVHLLELKELKKLTVGKGEVSGFILGSLKKQGVEIIVKP